MTSGLPASRVKLLCLSVVLAGGAAGAIGGRSDMAVMLGVFGVALFAGLGLVPMSKVSAQVTLPVWFAGLFALQAVAISGFVLVQPVAVDSPSGGSRVGLLGLLGHRAVGNGTPWQVMAMFALLLAVGCCLAAFVALRQQARRPDWVQPSSEPIGFYAEGRGRRDGRG